MYKGKAIYNPSGKAREYSNWACNFYVGCSGGCTYCYLKKGRSKKILGGGRPILKKCFKNEKHAIEIFEIELNRNLIWDRTEGLKNGLLENGLFFSFTTDPLLVETYELTLEAVRICQKNDVPVKILTKNIYFAKGFLGSFWDQSKIALGVTLTGCDDLEKNANKNLLRIEAMKIWKQYGIKTFASIEPIIDFESSKRMIELSLEFCDLYLIGLESGKKYDIIEAQCFVEWLNEIMGPKIYLKKTLQNLSRYTNTELDEYFVEMDYNLFND